MNRVTELESLMVYAGWHAVGALLEAGSRLHVVRELREAGGKDWWQR